MVFGDGQIINIDLAPHLLELLKLVRSQTANDHALIQGTNATK